MLQKQPISLNFGKGLDTKTDPYQVQLGNFLALQNMVFNTSGRLTKRFGYNALSPLPNSQQTTITTLNDSLIVTGSNLYSFNERNSNWLNKGTIQPVQLNTVPISRNSTSQTRPDSAVASNGLICSAYLDSSGGSYYHITDSATGQQIVTRTALGGDSTNPKVYTLGIYFVITYVVTASGTPTIKYVAIPQANVQDPKPSVTISSTIKSIDAGYDGFVYEGNLYISWCATASAVRTIYLTSSLALSAISAISADADLIAVTADLTTNYIWVSYADNGTDNAFSAAYNVSLSQVVAPTQTLTAEAVAEITSIAINGELSVYFQRLNLYSYTDAMSDIRSDFVSEVTVTPPVSGVGAGTASSETEVLRSVGLASKPFFSSFTYTLKTSPLIQVTTKTLPATANIMTFISATANLFVTYGDVEQENPLDNSNQPTYFLIDTSGNIIMRLAYGNGGGYSRGAVLPSVSYVNDTYFYPYMFADFLTTVNKGTDLPSSTPVNAIYTQYGVNVGSFTLNTTGQQSSEIASALHLTGGQLWEFDGVKPVEHGFHVYPENVIVTTDESGGDITAQTYYYVATYEWTDNVGSLHRSAPSIPIAVTTTGTDSSNTVNVPTLRVTAKTASNPVRIVIYRWSTAQQIYYQITDVQNPIINDTTTDSIAYLDTVDDAAILGQTLLYTTGGVIENIAAPASIDSCLFDNRFFLIDAEDQNLLWFSKQVIETTPVEMSDLLTIYVAPTTGAQESTGPMKTIIPMDDKLIIFKENAIYYINGSGPDNTGANSTYSQPTFITAAVGCANPQSAIVMPLGIMFQSNKGIWLLTRDLQTKYIGAGVEKYNAYTILSAESIPETTQVRFVLNNSITLMYDYFFDTWATHSNTAAISATLFQGSHTYLNSYGQVLQETLGMFKDGAEPVLISLSTSWINIAGIQGLERFYFANLLGTYYTPFTLDVQFAYNYNPSAVQNETITPDNYAPNYGDEALWGSGQPWGGPGNVFTARVFPDIQKCQSFQMTITEVYDPSLGVNAGQGLSLSGLSLIAGVKRGFRTQSAAKSFGGSSS